MKKQRFFYGSGLVVIFGTERLVKGLRNIQRFLSLENKVVFKINCKLLFNVDLLG